MYFQCAFHWQKNVLIHVVIQSSNKNNVNVAKHNTNIILISSPVGQTEQSHDTYAQEQKDYK